MHKWFSVIRTEFVSKMYKPAMRLLNRIQEAIEESNNLSALHCSVAIFVLHYATLPARYSDYLSVDQSECIIRFPIIQPHPVSLDSLPLLVSIPARFSLRTTFTNTESLPTPTLVHLPSSSLFN